MHQDGGFLFQLSPANSSTKPIPAVEFSKKIQLSVGDVLNKELKIYVTPTEFFTTKFRQIFKNTQIQFTTAKYGRKWLGGPHMSFWRQQLSFALWCATTGCGIPRDILFSSDSSLDPSPQLRTFSLFHVYFTVRRILYEMGGIQSMSGLPDDLTFNQRDNHYIFHPTKGSVLSSVSTPAQTFASRMVKTTVWAMCTLGSHMRGPDLLITTIQTQT